MTTDFDRNNKGLEGNKMWKMPIKIIAAMVLAPPMVLSTAALVGSTNHEVKAGQAELDPRFVRCMQTTNQPDFCRARVVSRQFQVVDIESGECKKARRNIVMYMQALDRLNLNSAKHRHAASIYRAAQRSEIEWYKQRC
jgi:hypothetical protein